TCAVGGVPVDGDAVDCIFLEYSHKNLQIGAEYNLRAVYHLKPTVASVGRKKPVPIALAIGTGKTRKKEAYRPCTKSMGT
ncbi:MAG: hypothetical protein RRY64_07200, partial [Oscillospiraceae bacterium]